MSDILEEAAFRGWAATVGRPLDDEARQYFRDFVFEKGYRNMAKVVLAYAAEVAREEAGIDLATNEDRHGYHALREFAAKLSKGQ